jgi:hypothetical protein
MKNKYNENLIILLNNETKFIERTKNLAKARNSIIEYIKNDNKYDPKDHSYTVPFYYFHSLLSQNQLEIIIHN